MKQNQSNYISSDFSGETLVSEEAEDGVVVVTTEVSGDQVKDSYASLLYQEGDGLRLSIQWMRPLTFFRVRSAMKFQRMEQSFC